jgi:hypothetical protein
MEFEIQPLDGQPILSQKAAADFRPLERAISFVQPRPPRPSRKRKRAEPFRAQALSRRGQTTS